MGNFYFEQLLSTALGGIDSSNIMTSVLAVAGSILLLSFLYSAYEAFAGGGDVRVLAASGAKYLVLGLIFAAYGTVFRDLIGMFSSVADFIYSSTGVGDLFSNWLNQLSSYAGTSGWSSMWGLISGGISGFLSMLIIMAGFIIYPLSYLLFTVFYALYGSILYVVGPFVLALLPSRSLGVLARTYAVNLMIFGAWSIIYAIIQVLMSAINLNSIDSVLNANGVLNSFIGSGSMILLALVSVLFSICIAFIPYFASRIVRGEVGSTMLALGGAAVTVASTAAALAGKGLSGGAGFRSGSQPPDGPPPPPPPPTGGVGAGAASTGYASRPPSALSVVPAASASAEHGGTSSSGSSAPPTSPSTEWRRNVTAGRPQSLSFAGSAFWQAGYTLGKLMGPRRSS
ncbi:MAG TPA: hypothetical protein VG860_02140 [Terriglobia bacterium]|jgi:hypothetical protein|nr:hypothetical protein [Terriglobia bacterium]